MVAPPTRPNLLIRLTHTGFYADGRPNRASVFIPDLDTGAENQNRKVPVYVPTGGSIDINASSRSILSYESGAINKFVLNNVIDARMFYIPESIATINLPSAALYPAGTFVWNTTTSAPSWSDGVNWVSGIAGPAGGDLGGTYPNPIVRGLEGIPLELPPPSNGDVIVYNGVANEWQHASLTFGGGPPVGPAGGDLDGLYPDPDIRALAVDDTKVALANKDGLAATPSMRTLGAGALQSCAGNDARLSNNRYPTAHAASHAGGADPLTVNSTTATNTPLVLDGWYHVEKVENPGTSQGTIGQNVASVAPTAQPGIARPMNVNFPAGWVGGTVTVNGTGRGGVVVSETYIKPGGGGTVQGAKVFLLLTDFVNSAPAGGAGTNATISLHDAYGVPHSNVTAFLKVSVDGVADAFATTDLANGTFEPVSTHHGNHTIDVWYLYTANPLQAAHTHSLSS